ncbi:MAG: ATP-binding cassette domain-containing protein [Bifidobacteriaceae bacterium]|nr:ATP-binding cassette domain-containing protein [Bifidobacteriaceae bacterium]
MTHPELLDIRNLSKSFGRNLVLKNVSLQGHREEILGLLGANGAGKSTLLRIIAGVFGADRGTLAIDGKTIDFAHCNPREAARIGVRFVHQELSVFANLSVAENFVMAHGLDKTMAGRRLRSHVNSAIAAIFPNTGIGPGAETGALSMAERQMVEIAIAASQPGLRILILDEPTAALPTERARQLHSYLRERKARDGLLIIYVTHLLDEVLGVVDRLVVLRDGVIHWQGSASTTTRAGLLRHLGAEPRQAPPARAELAADPGQALVEARLASARGAEFRVAPGEVVGVAGLEGAGQRQLLRSVYASARDRRGRYAVCGGAAYVSGDRKREAVFGLWDVARNLTIASLSRLSRFGFTDRTASLETVRRWRQTLRIATPSDETAITELSGGNQQKVVIARGFASPASVVLLDDPTRGVDTQTKHQFYELLAGLRDETRAAVLYSTEDREFAYCDRVYVMANGLIVKELQGAEITREAIVHWSYGGTGASASPDKSSGRSTPSTNLSAIRSLGRRIGESRLSLVVALLAVVTVAMGLTEPATITGSGLGLLLEPGMALVLCSLAQMFVITAGDFDMGIGYAVGLANVLSATLLVTDPALGLIALMAMVAAYALMAVVAEVSGVPAIVVTLGSSFIWLGCGLVIQEVPGGAAPRWTGALTTVLPGIPLQIYLCVALAGAAWLALFRWRYGIAMRAFGNNREAFVETGRSPMAARVTLYTMAGLCVVSAGTLTTASTMGSDINASATLTLVSVAAVVIGGGDFSGGMVNPIGTVLAAIVFGLLPTLLYFSGVGPNYQTAVQGALLVAAMAFRRLVGGRER